MRSVNQIPTQPNLATVSHLARSPFWASNPPRVSLGEPLAETIRSVTIGHQFPFTGKLTFLSVRCSTFLQRECSTGFRSSGC